jgi:adenosylcobinamide-GDP ribazoletransferase
MRVPAQKRARAISRKKGRSFFPLFTPQTKMYIRQHTNQCLPISNLPISNLPISNLPILQSYTRIPCPTWVDHRPEFISLSTRYFPAMGWIVGSAYAGTIVLFSFVLSPVISILLGLAISILVTGAFHEDGFADVCDGFGGGWTKEKILTIMKDSRVGTYGVVGVVIIFGLKLSATLEAWNTMDMIPFILLILSSHSLSRMMAVTLIYSQPYARDDQDSKAKPVATGISFANFIIAIFFGLTPFIFLLTQTNLLLSLALLPMFGITWYLAAYFKKWIGGYTGDCLGATQQVTEVVFLLAMLVIWKFT